MTGAGGWGLGTGAGAPLQDGPPSPQPRQYTGIILPICFHMLIGTLIVSLLFTAEAQRTAEVTQRFPALYWAQGIETAETLRQHGIEQIAVPPDKVTAWRNAGFRVVAMSEQELARREKLLTPRIAGRSNVASATSRPWIDANGWRFVRKPAGKFYYDLPQNARSHVALAVAEAFAYKADAVLKIDPSDSRSLPSLPSLEDVGKMIRFLRELPAGNYSPIADIGVIDDGSPAMGEVMNLLTRRNLLFKIVHTPSPNFRVNLKLGTKEYPAADASDPSEFAQKIRRQLGDENRTLRIYGSETVIARFSGDQRGFRLHLLNYAGREIEGLRVKLLRASLDGGKAWAFGTGAFSVEAPITEDGAVEFSIPRMGAYAVIDGRRVP